VLVELDDFGCLLLVEPSATDGNALLSEVGADAGAVDTEHRRQFLHALARLVRLDESDDLAAA